MYKELILRVTAYSKKERIMKVIEIGMKNHPSILEELEMALIQAIRLGNGEIEEVKRNQEVAEAYDKATS